MIGVSFRPCGAENHDAFKDCEFFGGRYFVLYPIMNPSLMKGKKYQQMWAEDKIRHLRSWGPNAEPIQFECDTINGKRLRIKAGDRVGVRIGSYDYVGTVTSAQNTANVWEWLEGKDDWYLEVKWDDLVTAYWKQQYDGGKIVSVNGILVK